MKSRSSNYGPPFRINKQITAREVRLIDQNEQMIGVVDTRYALSLAEQARLDLVEIAPKSVPPVCKIIDYGKFAYQAKQNAKKAKQKQKIILVKEMRFRPNIGVGDLQTKIKTIRNFLEEGDKVKVSVVFRGREIANQEPGMKVAGKILEALADVGAPDYPPKMEGSSFVAMMSPLKKIPPKPQ